MAIDKRDVDHIPGFIDLDDRKTAVIAQLIDTPARSEKELIAKAQVFLLRASFIGNDGADPLAGALAADIVRVLSDRPCKTWPWIQV